MLYLRKYLSVLSLFSLIPFSAVAQEQTMADATWTDKFYLQVNLGIAGDDSPTAELYHESLQKYEFPQWGISENVWNTPTSNWDYSDAGSSGNTYKVALGYEVNSHFAFELGYVNFKEVKGLITSSDVYLKDTRREYNLDNITIDDILVSNSDRDLSNISIVNNPCISSQEPRGQLDNNCDGLVTSVVEVGKFSAKLTGWTLSAVGKLEMTENMNVFGKLGVIAWDIDSTSGTDAVISVGAEYAFDSFSVVAEYDSYLIDLATVNTLSIGAKYSF